MLLLPRAIGKNSPVVYEGSGLYMNGGEYVYKGKEANEQETTELLDDAFNTAQVLMKDMLVNAVRVFESYVDESYDDDMDGKGDED